MLKKKNLEAEESTERTKEEKQWGKNTKSIFLQYFPIIYGDFCEEKKSFFWENNKLKLKKVHTTTKVTTNRYQPTVNYGIKSQQCYPKQNQKKKKKGSRQCGTLQMRSNS